MLDDNALNSEQRKKRCNFYLRNGYQETGLFLSYLGVDYEVFCVDSDFQEDEFKEMMKTIHVKGFDPKYLKRQAAQRRRRIGATEQKGRYLRTGLSALKRGG